MGKRIGAVVTGGDFQALGVLRTLARKDVPVALLDCDHGISRYSRFRKKVYKTPRPCDRESYVESLIDLAKRKKTDGWVVIPIGDEVVYILSKYKETLERYYRIPTPGWDVIESVYIKEKTYKIAERNGIPIPKTFFPQNLKELLALELQYPVVIKPSIRDNFYSKVKTKAFRVNSQEDLVTIYKEVCTVIDPSEVLVQDLIPGGPNQLYSCSPFFKNGRIIAYVTARRTRQHPMDFGHASTFAESVNIPELFNVAERFLDLIGYYGIAEVEFMKDPRDGEFKLIEVNPRIWGWHTLAIAAGVDLPYILYKDMIGENIEVKSASENIKWVRLLTDIPTVFLELAKGNMSVRDYLSSMCGKKEFAVFALDDPLPFFAEILMSAYLYKKKGF